MPEKNISSFNEDKMDTVLAPDINFSGTLRFHGSLMIKGSLKGEIVATGANLFVDKDSVVQASVKTGNIENRGRMEGNVEADQKYILYKSGVHKGDLITSDLYIESGAVFNGNCTMPENF